MNKDDYNFKLWCIVFIYYLFLFIYWSNPGNRSNKIVALFFFYVFAAFKWTFCLTSRTFQSLSQEQKLGFHVFFLWEGGGGED